MKEYKRTMASSLILTLTSTEVRAESFYDVKYWTSIITSNVCQINLSNENIKINTGVARFQNSFPKKIFWHFNVHFVLKTFIWDMFQITEKKQPTKNNNFLTNIWCNNWHFSIWRHKKTPEETGAKSLDIHRKSKKIGKIFALTLPTFWSSHNIWTLLAILKGIEMWMLLQKIFHPNVPCTRAR